MVETAPSQHSHTEGEDLLSKINTDPQSVINEISDSIEEKTFQKTFLGIPGIETILLKAFSHSQELLEKVLKKTDLWAKLKTISGLKNILKEIEKTGKSVAEIIQQKTRPREPRKKVA